FSVQRLAGDAWELLRIRRQAQTEQAIYESVSSPAHGLKYGLKEYPPQVFQLRARVSPVDFLLQHVPRLTAAGFEIYGEEKLKSARVNRSQPSLSLNVTSGIDWFDLQALVSFGDTEASLQEIRRALKKKQRYVKLADGTIGEIPEEWVARYKHLFGLGEQQADGVRLSNHHLGLIDQLLAQADRVQADDAYHQRSKRLLGFEGIQPQALPQGFQGELRPYQKAGFDWLHFLHEFEFGGCLADDMGLGKTIETLAFLLSLKESGHATAASLLVLPRSLLVNWQREAARFTPALRILEYFGQERRGALFDFKNYDLVLTTYGVLQRDIERLRKYKFHYVVLDESQAIKNPLAKTSKAARLLRCDHRLVLTGTPVENSTFELWSQFAFLNPGLLGNLEYFRNEFGTPIEKQNDEQAARFLRKMVYPFILRRTKAQVAPELPPRTERILYADMEPAQRKFYEKTRDYYRAMLLGVIESQGMNNARMQVLEGLLRLRQISNHPRLVDADFRGRSAKFDLLLETLETLRAEGHKALVFSQFVQMLSLLRQELDRQKIPYEYLDGSTHDRQGRVDHFQEDQTLPFFLISLKAGGVGLNLTAADYVIHIDPWWNPAVEMQATDRTHRIGQEKPVFVYKLIARDSIEEKVLQLQEQKKQLVDQLITTESSFFKNLTQQDVEGLFS
ncbi:MAG: SNF2 helicase associated domain-containing protein, partial [Anaerolineales bacterium]|nr:SNF2 helicase associated domain-containing protein [Anaerolineales bacterium]